MYNFNRDLYLEAVSSGANFIPLAHSWPADLETPLTTWLKVGDGYPPGVLLESVEGGETLGRWSVVATDPLWVATAKGDSLSRSWRDGRTEKLKGNPFEGLRKWLSPYRPSTLPDLPPLGQLYGIWGYELIKWIEPKVNIHLEGKDHVPDGAWMMMDNILIFDQVRRLITAVVYADLTEGQPAEIALDRALERINILQGKMAGNLPNVSTLNWENKSDLPTKVKSNFDQKEFEEAVEKAKEHIRSGDVFQLVLSQRIESHLDQKPFDLYRSLRMVNPSPYMAFFDFGDWSLIGSSPEVMVKAEPSADGIRASLRPIAGTRPRGSNHEQDAELEQELLADPKERAEHVMLVDLGRNDLGRVCRPGTVSVKELMVIEKYSHVMHIVSEVEGFLKEDMDVWDLLMASFPAGTVTGAPKIRAMQLINDLEHQSRGPYSGVYGSMDLCGALNTAITIRTMIVVPNSQEGSDVYVQAGAGVVADSLSSAEYQETLNKARGMLKALACLKGVEL